MQYFISGLLFVIPLLAVAHETDSHYDRINLNASAQQQIENDTVIATFYAEEEGSKSEQLANLVNKKIQWAVNIVKKHKDIKVQTNSYTTNPVYKKNKIFAWRVRQSIRLESQDMPKTSELLGKLQEKLALQGMHFTVSHELKTKTDDELITKAMSAFEKRAELVVKQLKRKSYKIVDMNISTSGGVRPYRTYDRVSTLETVTAPAVEAGEQTVQVNVSGSIELE